jgi:hypothetical protein
MQLASSKNLKKAAARCLKLATKRAHKDGLRWWHFLAAIIAAAEHCETLVCKETWLLRLLHQLSQHVRPTGLSRRRCAPEHSRPHGFCKRPLFAMHEMKWRRVIQP